MGGKTHLFFRMYCMKGKPLSYLASNLSRVAKLPLFGFRYVHNSSLYCYDLVAACVCERKSLITQNLTQLEENHFSLTQKLEEEYSYLSDHEVRQQEDARIAEKFKRGEIDMDVAAKQTAEDFDDLCLKDFNKFQPASRVTKADLCNDQRSTQRKLDQSLVFVVRQKLGNDFRWLFPQGINQNGETLRQTAERGLREICGDSMKVRFMGNAPVGFYKYKYPKMARGNGIYGAKVFFFKAQLLHCSEFFKSDIVDDYRWLNQPELKSLLQPFYYKAVAPFLLTDEIPEEIEDAEKDIRNIQTAVS